MHTLLLLLSLSFVADVDKIEGTTKQVVGLIKENVKQSEVKSFEPFKLDNKIVIGIFNLKDGDTYEVDIEFKDWADADIHKLCDSINKEIKKWLKEI